MNKWILLGLLVLIVPFANARLFSMEVVTPDTGCSIYGCVFMGDINMNGYIIYNATFVNASIHEFDPIFNAWVISTYNPENTSIWDAINSINQSLNTSNFVRKTGDTMTGALNMSNHDITDVNILYVHNITGRSPIYINSPMISQTNITADNFYGNFQGDNGTIYGVNINNGSIVNLHVTGPDAMFDGNVLVNGTINASDYNLEGDDIWINKQNRTFYFNETKLAAFIANNTPTPPNGTTNLTIKYYTGANLTGVSGSINRLLDTGMTVSIVNVDTFVLQPTWDYTAPGHTITFLNPIWDDQIITVYGNTGYNSTNYLGAVFSGIDGTTGRTLNVTANTIIVVNDNFMLQKNIDFTFIGNTLTMLNELWDDQRITVWVVN